MTHLTSWTIAWLLCRALVSAQAISPSNSTTDIYPESISPRYWVNASHVGFRIAPLGSWARISHNDFVSQHYNGRLEWVNTANPIQVVPDMFSYVCCDPEAYTGVLSASDVFQMVVNTQQANAVILYSKTSGHCVTTAPQNVHLTNGLFTTLDVTVAEEVESRLANETNGLGATIAPDLASYTNQTNGWGGSYGAGSSNSPTTAVAMIILYAITGIITTLFVVIIVTGAVRAHRHPERYGPRDVAGRPRQSRAKGIARAMLETLPIVKFGDHNGDGSSKKMGDVEMTSDVTDKSQSNDKAVTAMKATATAKPTTATAVATADAASTEEIESQGISKTTNANANTINPDGTDDDGHLGCPICTEDFNQGEEVRVLPCNHKFHPECVDPWLLNVSGTCPLCRIDLRSKDEQRSSSAAASASNPDALAPPLAGPPSASSRRLSMLSISGNGTASSRRETYSSLRQLVSGGSREDRIDALRTLRRQQEHQQHEGRVVDDETRRGLSRRLRERFRIRTGRQSEAGVV